MPEKVPQGNSGHYEPPNPDLVDWTKARKSSHSYQEANCVEVATGEGVVGFQNSRQEDMKDRPRLAFEAGVAATFFAAVQDGRFDLPPQ
jgi:hypothetical protein